MTTSRCQAKDPTTCPHHTENAASKAKTAILKAGEQFSNARTFEAKKKADTALKTAEAVYDATDEGYRDLRNQAREIRGIASEVFRSQQLTARIIKAKLTRANDSPTEAQIVTVEDMKTKHDELKKVISSGNSDRFYDVYEKSELSLNEAQLNGSVPAYTRIVNNLADDLINTSQEQNWFNAKDQQAFEQKVKNMKYKGTFIGSSQATLENTNPKMTFEL